MKITGIIKKTYELSLCTCIMVKRIGFFKSISYDKHKQTSETIFFTLHLSLLYH